MIIALYWMTWTVAMYLDHCQEWPEWANVVVACISVVALIVALVRWHDMTERVKRLEEIVQAEGKLTMANADTIMELADNQKEIAEMVRFEKDGGKP